jgi:hypothetical protein
MSDGGAAALEITKALVQGVPVAAVLFYAWREERNERRAQDEQLKQQTADFANLAKGYETAVRENTAALKSLRKGLEIWLGQRIDSTAPPRRGGA